MRFGTRVVVAAVFTLSPLSIGCAQRSGDADSATAQRVMSLLNALSDDSLKGRATGSPGEAAAARIIAAELARAGLQPAGDSGWFQRVPIAYQTVTRNNQSRRVMRLQPSFAARDTFPVADRVTAVNVAGILVGSDPALRDEAVVIDAHYDHVGTAQAPVNGDSIYNGADDDASGVVTVLEVARMLAASPQRPRRTIIFLLTTGEEVGLLGTRWYIEHPVRPLERTVANLEIEMIGRPDPLAGGTGKAWLTGYDRSTMGQLLRDNGIPLVADPRPGQRFFERSDNFAFALRGIPAHTISSFNMHTDYHTVTDEARLVDAAHMAAVINATARAARLLADGPAPQWMPNGRPAARP